MRLLQRILRAEYLWQPGQLARRAARVLRGPAAAGRTVVRLPWKLSLTVDPRDIIGRSIVALNALDLPVTETIWRLADPGDTCVDVGANIGYMTSAMAARAGREGSVVAFEPVPELASALRENVRGWAARAPAPVRVVEAALADRNGAATLHIPESFPRNRGEATLLPPPGAGTPPADHRRIQVPVTRLDDALARSEWLGVVKIDVEGTELGVLRGAERLLRERRMRDIVLEEFLPFEPPSLRFLREHGYAVFRVVRAWAGPRLRSPDWQPARELDPPTYLATLDAERAQARFAARGWASLSGTHRL